VRPLLILDCDEVILHFAAPFQQWLRETQDMELTFNSFSLTKNLRRIADDSLVAAEEFPALLDGFFAGGQELQQPVPGVVEALADLRKDMDIAVLTNIADAHSAMRISVLRRAGLDLPVHANRGPKGAAVAKMAQGRRAVFVDDLPPHHQSVADLAAAVGRLHMVADPVLRPLIAPAQAAHARIDDWPQAAPWIRARIEEGTGA